MRQAESKRRGIHAKISAVARQWNVLAHSGELDVDPFS